MRVNGVVGSVFSILITSFVSQPIWAEDLFIPLETRTVVNEKKIDLDLCYVENNRFVSLSDSELKQLVRSAEKAVRTYLDLNVQIEIRKRISVSELFETIPGNAKKYYGQWNFGWMENTGNVEALKRGVIHSLGNTSSNEIKKFTTGYLIEDKKNVEFYDSLIQTMLIRLHYWKNIKDKNGGELIGVSDFSQWVMWEALGYGENSCNIIVTNQPVISAEYYGMSVHTMLRGGVNVGGTFYSKKAKYNKYSFITVFPFIENNDQLKYLRGGEEFTRNEALDLTGLYLTHELGHLLLNLGHPFNQSECIMNPVTMLEFKNWASGLNSKECGLNSSGPMTPGAVSFYYNSAL